MRPLTAAVCSYEIKMKLLLRGHAGPDLSSGSGLIGPFSSPSSAATKFFWGARQKPRCQDVMPAAMGDTNHGTATDPSQARGPGAAEWKVPG